MTSAADVLDFRLPTPTIRQTPRHELRERSVSDRAAAIDPARLAAAAQEIQFELAEHGERISTTDAVQRAMKRLAR